MKKTDKYYKVYIKLATFGFNKDKMCKLLMCSRNTLKKIEDEEPITENKRIEQLFEIVEDADKKFFQQLLELNNNLDKYETYFLQNPKIDMHGFNEAFYYPLRYLKKDKEEKNISNEESVITSIRQHMYNFHMNVNPYYMVMRKYFDKEVRPLLDFNIEFKSKRIKDLQIVTLRTAKFNKMAIEKQYKLDYSNKAKMIFEDIDKLTERQKNYINENNIVFEDCSIDNMSYEDFINFLYVFSLGYSNKELLRFSIYEDNQLKRMEYISEKVSLRLRKRCKEIKYYNFARFFNIDKDYYELEKVLINYKFHRIWKLSSMMKNNKNSSKYNVAIGYDDELAKEEYINKLYSEVEFRVKELENLILMVSGLEYKDEDNYKWLYEQEDEEDNVSNDIYEERIKEIENRRAKHYGNNQNK